MVVIRDQSIWGHCPPPENSYSVLTNMRGWESIEEFNRGDMSKMMLCTHYYPRFFPSQFVAQLGMGILQGLGIQGKAILLFLNPDIFAFSRKHVAAKERGQFAMDPSSLLFKCVDIAGHRLYCILFDFHLMPAVLGVWANIGIGISIRTAEHLLAHISTLAEVPIRGDALPEPTWTPEGPSHKALRERIHELIHRAPRDPSKVTASTHDIFLYPSGMAAIYYANNHLQAYRPGHVVMLGLPYQSTYDYLAEQHGERLKLIGAIGEGSMDELEAWLDAKARHGQTVSYVITEMPINPLTTSPDTARLHQLSEKHGFAIIIDDTVGGFANIDILPHADLVITSLTKTFSGLANVLGGSITLNPLSRHHPSLSPALRAAHRNELFPADADTLLSNSRDFLPRTIAFNRNAHAMAAFLHSCASDPSSPVAKVWYPPFLPCRTSYDAVKRRPSPDLPHPGYGCLLTVDFDCKPAAVAFYDRLGFVIAGHLGAPQTLAVAYNIFAFGKSHDQMRSVAGFGMREAAVRISAGLEAEEDLIDTLRDALEAAAEAKKAAGGC